MKTKRHTFSHWIVLSIKIDVLDWSESLWDLQNKKKQEQTYKKFKRLQFSQSISNWFIQSQWWFFVFFLLFSIILSLQCSVSLSFFLSFFFSLFIGIRYRASILDMPSRFTRRLLTLLFRLYSHSLTSISANDFNEEISSCRIKLNVAAWGKQCKLWKCFAFFLSSRRFRFFRFSSLFFLLLLFL